ncbi:CDGSH iron-sulfur domain-containing protein 2-like [Halichondria panicea]|uniref:CDGSH iron-sulfur domain-containing protein 2-like n=1 Tax=Halichondria panicea TaxID=6063 RepID=UPI001AFB5C64|nr:CDGSH iron sulfur domain 2 [Halichondria panicea]
MEAVWRYFKVQLPGYLKSIPLPKSLAGFSALNRAEWLELLPFFVFLLILLYLIFSPFLNFVSRPKQPRPKINKKIRKDEPKVADKFDIEDLGDKVSLCRCWKSAKFPYCDGAHKNHNKETGDNVGPAVLCRNKK